MMNGGSDGGTAASILPHAGFRSERNANVDDDVDEKDDENKKMFFTTSDLIARMNTAVKDASADIHNGDISDSPPGGGFELQRKLPDGSYRRAEEGERAAADFQAKMKQASEMIAGLDPERKIEWAKCQRKEGNALFARGEYKEAMDVYLTCLVAMDRNPAPPSNDSSSSSSCVNDGDEPNEPQRTLLDARTERDVKLPVLLNLALSAVKLGMPSKAERFCDFAMETEAGRQSVKAHFRRGSVRALAGRYEEAEADLDRSLELNAANRRRRFEAEDSNGETVVDDGWEEERAAIVREKNKLRRLVHRAEKNRKQQRRAMEKFFQSGEDENPASGSEEGASGLYPEMKGPERIPPPPPNGCRRHYVEEDYQLGWFGWYLRMIGRCAQKLLDVIGEEDEYDEGADGDIRRIHPNSMNELTRDKKEA